MLALQCVDSSQLCLGDGLVQCVWALERGGSLRERRQHRSDQGVPRACDVDDLVVCDPDRREVLEHDNAAPSLVVGHDLACVNVAGLVCPPGGLCLLPRDPENGDESSLAALDDEMLEERKEVDGHLCDPVLHEEGKVTGGGLVLECPASRELFELYTELGAESHVVDDLPPILVRC